MRTIIACALENLTDYHGKDKVRIFELLSEYLQKFVNKPITQILPNSINIRRLNKYFNNVFYSVLYDNLYIGEREIKSGNEEDIVDRNDKGKGKAREDSISSELVTEMEQNIDEKKYTEDPTCSCYVKNTEPENDKVKLGNPLNTKVRNRDKIILEY